MQSETPGQGAAAALEWAEGAHRNACDFATMLGVAPERFEEDTLAILPRLENYVARLPLDEFEESDWITLHTDLTSVLGDFLVRRHGAKWIKVCDAGSPAGFRYFIEVRGFDGKLHRVEPYDVVMDEFHNMPIEVTRMLANAESELKLSPEFNDS
ncbi:hypothetical protein ACFYO9_14145 [Streptomyces sp. NPDC005863]|uniref:hypothetical protein n=1 Tax=unclassified Streptomyces TaxID=2593676 RepID=UPI0033CFE91F